jgi:hypothetical protein
MIPKMGTVSGEIMRQFKDWRAIPQIGIRNLRKLDCFPQNRYPLLLMARLRDCPARG